MEEERETELMYQGKRKWNLGHTIKLDNWSWILQDPLQHYGFHYSSIAPWVLTDVYVWMVPMWVPNFFFSSTPFNIRSSKNFSKAEVEVFPGPGTDTIVHFLWSWTKSTCNSYIWKTMTGKRGWGWEDLPWSKRHPNIQWCCNHSSKYISAWNECLRLLKIPILKS